MERCWKWPGDKLLIRCGVSGGRGGGGGGREGKGGVVMVVV